MPIYIYIYISPRDPGSMYCIATYMYHTKQLNVGK